MREHLVAHTKVEEVRAGTDQRCPVIPLVGYIHSAFAAAEWASRHHHVKLLEEARAGVGEDGPIEWDPESGGPALAGDGSAP